jgi:uncharacterized OB-fold protein
MTEEIPQRDPDEYRSEARAETMSDQQITHAVTCENCGRETFAFERDCHWCGVNRWWYDG